MVVGAVGKRSGLRGPGVEVRTSIHTPIRSIALHGSTAAALPVLLLYSTTTKPSEPVRELQPILDGVPTLRRCDTPGRPYRGCRRYVVVALEMKLDTLKSVPAWRPAHTDGVEDARTALAHPSKSQRMRRPSTRSRSHRRRFESLPSIWRRSAGTSRGRLAGASDLGRRSAALRGDPSHCRVREPGRCLGARFG
jgi:hypothetical protein